MLTVFCTKVGDRYGQEYVNRLAAMFRRNLTIPHRFVCTTDDPKGIDKRVEIYPPALSDAWGWWNLEEAYRPPRWADGPIFYTGLDTIITGNIDRAIDGRTKLTLIYDFSCLVPNYSGWFANTWADGIAYIPEGGVPEVWEAFLRFVDRRRQEPMHIFNTYVLRGVGIEPDIYQEVCPGLVCSFKWPEIKWQMPPEPIVCFHGKPRPQDVQFIPWVNEHWRE